MKQNNISDKQLVYLNRLNWATGIIHLASAIVIFIITDKTAQAPLLVNYPDPSSRGAITQPKELAKVTVGYFAAVFLLLAAIDHIAMASFLRSRYEKGLKVSQNHFRWIEYSISASLMHVMIAMLCGIFDIHILLGIFGLTMTTMTFGSLQESSSHRYQGRPEKKSLTPFWLGCIPWLVGWGIICSYFFHAAAKSDPKPPDFVWSIIFIIIALDTTFAINMFLQQKEIGKWKDYYYGEVAFIILSITSKSLLAWLNFGGTRAM